MKVILYCQNQKSNKFWEIEDLDLSLKIRFGKIGTPGRSLEKVYTSRQAALAEYEKLIQEKRKGGYVDELKELALIDWSNMKMTEEIFWEILALLNWKKLGDDDLVLKPAILALSKMEISEIYAFDELLAAKLHAIDTKAHAEAPYGKDQSFSADGFLYNRCVAVVNGPEYYEKILCHKNSLDCDCEFEAVLSLADNAYELKTGEEYDYATELSYESCTNLAGWK